MVRYGGRGGRARLADAVVVEVAAGEGDGDADGARGILRFVGLVCGRL